MPRDHRRGQCGDFPNRLSGLVDGSAIRCTYSVANPLLIDTHHTFTNTPPMPSDIVTEASR